MEQLRTLGLLAESVCQQKGSQGRLETIQHDWHALSRSTWKTQIPNLPFMLAKAVQGRLQSWSLCPFMTAFPSQQEFLWEREEIKLFSKWTKDWFQVCLTLFSYCSYSCYFLQWLQVKLETLALTNECKSTLCWSSPQTFTAWAYL